MNTKLVAIASALVATTALASTAEAGGGVRLGFGVPLGSFVATPAHGGGGSYRAPKKAPATHVARKPVKPEPRVAKVEPVKVTPKPSVDLTETKAEEGAPVTGSSALIQGSIPAVEPATEATTPDVKAEAPASSTVTAHTDKAPDESEGCKKFIPAVGMTVSVGCE